MYPSLLQLALLFGITVCLVVGNPLPQAYPINTCQGGASYKNNHEEHFSGDPVTGSTSCDASDGGCTLTEQSTYSVGVTVETGGGLDIGDIVSAGVSVSVSTTTETGTASGGEKSCPTGDYTCALAIQPAMVRVSGVKTSSYLKSDGTCGSQDEDYTVTMPRKGQDNIAGQHVDTCVCKNFPGSDDEAAPSNVCPQDCY